MQLIGYVVITVLVLASNWTPSDAMTLHCTYDLFPFHIVGAVYRCEGKVTLDGENDDKITAVYGTHLRGKRNEDVYGLIIRSQDMPFFPVNIESFFPDLKVINFPENAISSVTKEHLRPFPNLQFLALFKNRITSLESDLFSELKSLKFINFGRNRIKHAGQDIALPDAAEIFLYSNWCIDRDAETELEVTYMRLSLLVNCPPPATLTDKIPNDRKEMLKNKYLQLAMRVSISEAMRDSTRCLNIESESV